MVSCRGRCPIPARLGRRKQFRRHGSGAGNQGRRCNSWSTFGTGWGPGAASSHLLPLRPLSELGVTAPEAGWPVRPSPAPKAKRLTLHLHPPTHLLSSAPKNSGRTSGSPVGHSQLASVAPQDAAEPQATWGAEETPEGGGGDLGSCRRETGLPCPRDQTQGEATHRLEEEDDEEEEALLVDRVLLRKEGSSPGPKPQRPEGVRKIPEGLQKRLLQRSLNQSAAGPPTAYSGNL